MKLTCDTDTLLDASVADGCNSAGFVIDSVVDLVKKLYQVQYFLVLQELLESSRGCCNVRISALEVTPL